MTDRAERTGLREAVSSWIVIGLLTILTIANAVTAVSFAKSARNLGGAEAASNAVIRLLSEVKAQGGCDVDYALSRARASGIPVNGGGER